MIRFILGTMFGGLLGILTMCLCIMAGEAEKQFGLK